MIQPLRAVHFHASIALTLLLPTILWIGLRGRHPRIGPSANATDVPDPGNMVSHSSNLWQKYPIQSNFFSKPNRPLDRYVVLLPVRELNEPDLLLYWAANAPQGNVLPENAQLVAAFAAGKAFLLPLNDKGPGHLVLFSQAHQTVFDTATLKKLP